MTKKEFEDIYAKAMNEKDYSFMFLNMRAPTESRIIFNL